MGGKEKYEMTGYKENSTGCKLHGQSGTTVLL